MNTKYALALILTLQVSMSLCETPTELPEKCNNLSARFFKRLENAYAKVNASVTPLVEDSPIVKAVRELINETPVPKYLGAASGVASNINVEYKPLEGALKDLCVLALKSSVGPYLESVVTDAQFFLDKFMPAE